MCLDFMETSKSITDGVKLQKRQFARKKCPLLTSVGFHDGSAVSMPCHYIDRYTQKPFFYDEILI